MSLLPTYNENKLVTCPYDEAHKVKESRLQLHIAKCKLNHLDLAKKICPFNATHLLPVGEFDHHLTTCSDRAPLDRQLAQAVNRNNPFKGRTDVPNYSEPIHLDEVWEIESNTVHVPQAPPPGAILQPGDFQKPAERKKFYTELHQIPTKAEIAAAKQAQTVPVKTVLLPPRQPKQNSKIEDTNKPSANAIENLGLGRGRPVTVSRIAANFPKESAEVSTTYSSIVSDMSSLGLGRGKSNNLNKAPASIFDDDDDFPALGCGRGIMHKQQNVRQPGAKPKN